MKRYFAPGAADTAAPAPAPAPVVNIAPEPTSEKLTEIRGKMGTAWAEVLKFPDPMSKESKDARMAYFQLEQDEKAEIAGINKAANDAKLAEARSERLKLNSDMLAAYAILLQLPKTATEVDKTAAKESFDKAKEIVDNELLAKYATSRPARSTATTAAADGQTVTAKSADRQEIVALYLQGKTHKDIEAAGFKRSTVWHAINDYKKANGIA